jgi:hypothetical protein
MSEFVFTRKKKAECTIVVDSSLESDLSAAELLVKNIEDISGVKLEIQNSGNIGDKKQTKIFLGSLSKSPRILKMLEEQNIIIGLNTPEIQKSIKKNKNNPLEAIKSGMLRRNYLFPDAIGEQEFIVYKLSDNALILSGGPRGTLYAVQTLINHMYIDKGNLKVEDFHSEKFPIYNRPAISYRGICTNIGGPDHLSAHQWEKEWEKDGEYDYKGFIDWLVQFKINHIDIWLFELGFGIAYPSEKFPECVNQYHPNVKKEFIGDMIEYAHSKYITVSMFIDFPDMFSGILRHHPELGAKQFDPSQLPPDEEWKEFQKSGTNKHGHYYFRGKFGTVCASKPEVMNFWEAYLEEVFKRYPGLDGITGQFAEYIDVCKCDNCQKNFFKLQWKYFKRMAEVVQTDRPDRKIYNCMSPGDVEIVRHRAEIKNFINLDWGDPILDYQYGRGVMRGEWHLLHHMGEPWFESDWKDYGEYIATAGQEGVMRRTVSFKPQENDHFAFGEFSWNPKLRIEDYADIYVKKCLRKKDVETALLYSCWIKARRYAGIIEKLNKWKEKKTPFSAKAIDKEYPRLLKKEINAISSLLKKSDSKNELFNKIKDAFLEEKDKLLELV